MQSLAIQWYARLNTPHDKPTTTPLGIRASICCLTGNFGAYFLIRHEHVTHDFHSPQINLELHRNNDIIFTDCTLFSKGNVHTSDL